MLPTGHYIMRRQAMAAMAAILIYVIDWATTARGHFPDVGMLPTIAGRPEVS
jgi:hypothetical protein